MADESVEIRNLKSRIADLQALVQKLLDAAVAHGWEV